MRSLEVWREAVRNFGSGASRGLLSLVVFLAVALLLGIVATRGVVGVAEDAAVFRSSGASVFRLDAPGTIDGAACDVLGTVDGIDAAGATRAADKVKFALLPDLPAPYFDASPGIIDVLDANPDNAGAGLLIDRRLATALGIDEEPASTFVLGEQSAVTVAAAFEHPDDGRDSTLSGAALGVVVDQRPFDACWVQFWPPTENPLDIMGSVVTGSSEAGSGDVTQWNLTLGRTLDPDASFRDLPLVGIAALGAAVAAALAYVSVRTRRLEFASALHVGVHRTNLIGIVLAETALWLVPASAFALTALMLAATWSNPDPAFAAWLAGARVVVASVGAWVLSTAIATGTVREAHLVRFFQQR